MPRAIPKTRLVYLVLKVVEVECHISTHYEESLFVLVEIDRHDMIAGFRDVDSELKLIQNFFEVYSVPNSHGNVHDLVGVEPVICSEKHDIAHSGQIEPLRAVDQEISLSILAPVSVTVFAIRCHIATIVLLVKHIEVSFTTEIANFDLNRSVSNTNSVKVWSLCVQEQLDDIVTDSNIGMVTVYSVDIL